MINTITTGSRLVWRAKILAKREVLGVNVSVKNAPPTPPNSLPPAVKSKPSSSARSTCR